MKQFFARNIHFIYSIVIATAYIFYHGYSYPGGDQEEHLPLVIKMFDPALYQHDYYVSMETLTFSIRQYYVFVVYAFSTLLGIDYACLLLFFLCILLISYSFVKITAHITPAKYTPFFAPLIFLIFYNQWTVGGNYFVLPILICSVFAMALCSFAFLQFFKKNYMLMSICIGIAGLFQIVIALHVIAIVLVLLRFGEDKNKPVLILKCFSLFLLFSSPMLLPVLYEHFMKQGNYDMEYYYRILYYFRNPNHYLPSYFFPIDYVRFFVLSFTGFVVAWYFKLWNRKQLFAMYAVVYAGAVLYYLLLEKLHIYPIGKIQWFRATVWITAFSSLFMVIAAGKLVNVIFTNIKFSDKIIIPLLVAEVMMILVIFNGDRMSIAYFRQKYEFGKQINSDLTNMHFWIAENTAKDVIILTPPGDIGFLCEAKRSMPIGYTAVIHEAFFMIPWYEKFHKIYGVGLDDVGKITPAKNVAAEKYQTYNFKDKENLFKINYRIDNITTCKYLNELGPVVHKEGDYILTEMVKK
jgi:hypothetical protein